jgi:hypothetical protein
MRKFFRWLAIVLAGLLALLLAAGLVLSLLDVTVDLDHLRGGVETSAGAALGQRPQCIGRRVLQGRSRALADWIDASVAW